MCFMISFSIFMFCSKEITCAAFYIDNAKRPLDHEWPLCIINIKSLVTGVLCQYILTLIVDLGLRNGLILIFTRRELTT